MDPDLTLVAELTEQIDRHPPAIQARKLLVAHYLAVGWQDAAVELIRELKRLDPRDEEIKAWHTSFVGEPHHVSPKAQPQQHKNVRRDPPPNLKPVVQPADLPDNEDERAQVKQDFITSLKNFRSRASALLSDTRLLGKLQPHTKQQLQSLSHIDELQALAEGRITTAIRSRQDGTSLKQEATPQPQSVRAIAREMTDQTDQKNALHCVVTDLLNIVGWQRLRQVGSPDDDSIRDTLVKRVRALEAALPESSEIRRYPAIALMHMDHEQFKRKYVNDETMLGDAIGDIARESFFASEDGYAWDMDELAQAIASNDGVMRNPLSRQMFSREDIHFIVNHPAGKSLAAMQVEQSKLKQGIRPQTMDEMEKLAKVLLDDQSADQIPTRQAVDLFFAYVATLPQTEQGAIDRLKVPAKDSHTGQAFDGSIGESLRDAQGNRTCWHKTGSWTTDLMKMYDANSSVGDFIQQAAKYLRRS